MSRLINTETYAYVPDSNGKLRKHSMPYYISAESIERVRECLWWISQGFVKDVLFVTKQIQGYGE